MTVTELIVASGRMLGPGLTIEGLSFDPAGEGRLVATIGVDGLVSQATLAAPLATSVSAIAQAIEKAALRVRSRELRMRADLVAQRDGLHALAARITA